jgi:hypothetical protein
MSQDIGMTPNPQEGSGSWLRGLFFRLSPGCAGGLVVARWVEGQVAEEFAGGGVDDADVQVVDEQQDVGSGVGSADADVVEAAAVVEGDFAGGVGAVGADAVVGVVLPVAGGGFGPGGVGGGGGGLVGQGAVRPLVVVVAGEGVQQGLEFGGAGGLGVLGAQPVLQGLLESLRLPWVWGCSGGRFSAWRPGGAARARRRCGRLCRRRSGW